MGHSRWSWEETVKLTGEGKKGVGVDDEAVAVAVSGVVDDEAIVGVDESTEGNVPDPDGSVDDRPKGAVIPKVSPAPSQSELVSSGVWIWINSLSYTISPHSLPITCPPSSLPRTTSCPQKQEQNGEEPSKGNKRVGLTSNQSCHCLIIPSLTLITAAVCVVRNLK